MFYYWWLIKTKFILKLHSAFRGLQSVRVQQITNLAATGVQIKTQTHYRYIDNDKPEDVDRPQCANFKGVILFYYTLWTLKKLFLYDDTESIGIHQRSANILVITRLDTVRSRGKRGRCWTMQLTQWPWGKRWIPLGLWHARCCASQEVR